MLPFRLTRPLHPRMVATAAGIAAAIFTQAPGYGLIEGHSAASTPGTGTQTHREHHRAQSTASCSGLGLSAHQEDMARVIWRAAEANHADRRARVVAYAAAIQESGLRDLDGGHADSQGLFQMRGSFPEQWGTYTELDSPAYQADRFFKVLLHQNEDYASEPVTVAAQDVLRSAYPQAYAAHVDEARAVVAAAGCARGGGA